MNKAIPIVSIIGRTNVGKSTLFNLLVKNKAITSELPGTTRDINSQETEWLGKLFNIVDTGGIEDDLFLEKEKESLVDKKIIEHAKKIISQSHLILFIVDAKVGILPQDKNFASYLRKNKLNYVSVANKCGNKKERAQADEFTKLGLGEPTKIAAITGSGTGDLMDIIVEKIKGIKIKSKKHIEKEAIKIAFIGKTNVGKSSIINSILNEERIIVSDEEHTTRDAQFIPFRYKEQPFILIDTAGIRKKRTQIKQNELEEKSVEQSKKAVKKTDVIILVTDVSKNLSIGDMKIAQIATEAKKSLLVVANKWDLIDDKNLNTYNKYVKYYYSIMPFLWWAEILPVSAMEKTRVTKILDEAIKLKEKSRIEISKEDLEKFRQKIIKIHPPTIGKGRKRPKIYEIVKMERRLSFEIVLGFKTSLNESYVRFISKKIREEFNLHGVPISVYVKKLKKMLKK